MSSVGKQLLLTTALLGGVILGLTLLKKGKTEELPSPTTPAIASSKVSDATNDDETVGLFPRESWLLLRLASSLVEDSPFAGDAECERAPVPEYFYFAAGEAKAKPEEVAFWIGSEHVPEAFSRCVVKMIEKSGGKLVSPGLYLTPSGTLAFEGGRLLFSTDLSEKDSLTRRLTEPRSDKTSSHSLSPKANGNLLSASLLLSKSWLDAASESLHIRPSDSPLEGLESARFEVDRNRVGRGELRCPPEKCERLARFTHGAVSDLIATLPTTLRGRLQGALGVRYPVPGVPGRIELTLEPSGLDLLLAMVRYWSGAGGDEKP